MYFNPYSLPNFSIAFLSLIFGLIVYFRNAKSIINFSFLAFTIGLVVWLFCYGMIYSLNNIAIILLLARIGHSSVIFLSPIYYLFCISFLKKKREMPLVLITFLLSIILILLVFNSDLYLSGVTKRFWGYYPKGGILALLDFVIHLIVIARCCILYIASYNIYKKANDFIMCNKIKYMGFAFGVMLLAMVDYLPKYFDNVYPFGYIAALFLITITSVAIVKHNLLDINIVIRKSLVYSILVTMVTVIYFILVFLSEKIFSGFMGYRSIPLTMGIITLFILIFQPLKNRIQTFVDKVFFRKTQKDIIKENEMLMEQLQVAQKMKAVATLATGLAHEIKNPLTSIKTFTEFLDKKYADKEFRDKFQRIVGSEVERINSIVHQLLDFAKPKPLNIIDTNIQDILDNILSLLSNDLIKKRIDLTKEYAKENITIKGDPNQLKQAFLNIILNSIDAMKNGGTLTISTRFNKGKILIRISDTGIGIPKQDIPHIFDPFYSTKDTGTGLGLSIVHNIIREHGGIIKVESELDKGTTFEIII